MSKRASRCRACYEAQLEYCEHNKVLLVRMDGAAILIRGSSEDSARAVADRLSLKWRGRRFYSSVPKAEQQRGAARRRQVALNG